MTVQTDHRNETWKALRLTVPIALSYVPLGMALGVYLTSSGIAWYWAPISAMIIYAGSVEFLAVSFITTGVPIYVVAWTTFIVNFRHIFYGLTFPVGRMRSRLQVLYGIFALTDEVYAITSAGPGRTLSGRGVTQLQLFSHGWWTGGALLGAGIGSLIPPEIHGFDFALTATFVVLAVEAIRHSKDLTELRHAVIAVVAAFLSERILFTDSFLIAGLLTYLALVTADYRRGEKRRVSDAVQ